jgi:hypothetical protein
VCIELNRKTKKVKSFFYRALVYLPSGVFPITVPRPPNIPRSELISKLGLPPIPVPVCPGTLQQQENSLKKLLIKHTLQKNICRSSQSVYHHLLDHFKFKLTGVQGTWKVRKID